MAEQAIETSQRDLHRLVMSDSDTGDTVSNYRHGVFRKIVVGDSSSGTIAVTDTMGTVLPTTALTADSALEVDVPFEGVLTFTIGGTVNFTVILEV